MPDLPSTASRTGPSATRDATARTLTRASGQLSTSAMARMETDFRWFRDLSADDRSWVGLIVQAGVRGFVEWYAAGPDARVGTEVAGAVYGTAPRALARVITLRKTVDLIRLSIDVVEANIDALLAPEAAAEVHESISRYAREVAFATAEVYARAAEERGAWDARLEALVVDAVLRGETDDALLSRASALGWSSRELAVVLGHLPEHANETHLFDEVRRTIRGHSRAHEALCAVQGEQLVVLLGGVSDPRVDVEPLVPLFGPGPVVVGPVVPDLTGAHASARAALAAHRAASGWPEAPRPVLSLDLLPERALAGDAVARAHLVEDLYRPLAGGRRPLVETLATYFECGGSLEATARRLFVHPNTVRYRLRQITETTGLAPTDPREAFTLRIALVLGRQHEVTTDTWEPTTL
ncbi:PucR family transcriptional regulator [Nocardioides insulae]|uniref:PucR family transcriptional regulator n=1 Tax=Nocardioides insulae TaxID=394734 RepID=UPI000400DBD5|nr:helix-turn-helix domain-containing protein [Nocardioides insulae]